MTEVVYFRPDGTRATNAIVNRESEDGEMIFMEIIGYSGDGGVKPKLLLNGKEPYKRIYIQRVFPYVKVEDEDDK